MTQATIHWRSTIQMFETEFYLRMPTRNAVLTPRLAMPQRSVCAISSP
jgi:hypothetical protein